jgi:hypothetical protein
LEILPFFVEERDELITNYIIVPGSLPGKIIAKKLKEYGIKGKLISELQKEGSIEIEGRTIRIEDVREESAASPNVVLLHYNEKDTVHSILQNKRMSEFLHDKKNFIYSVIHIIEDSETVLSAEFKLLLSAFPAET